MPEILPKLSPEAARLLALNGQGLFGKPCGKGKKGTLKTIEALGYVQIDTLSVVSRAHHHILYSRVGDYKEQHLAELMKEKSVFEYWSHAASYLPMKDYRFSLPRKRIFAQGKSHWFEKDKKVMKYVLDRIKSEGPLQSGDFEFKRDGPGNWYEWKPAKKALEQLFMEGTLMVAERRGFQKVYDLTERVLPGNINLSMPSESEYATHLIQKAVEVYGVAEAREISYLRNGIKAGVDKALKKLLDSGTYIKVQPDGAEKGLFITSVDQLQLLNKLKPSAQIHILSPFDNLVIQRKRLLRAFNFDYQVECYVPEPKRKFGYFCLPVLSGNKFIGRFDPKADRAKGIFYLKVMHFEKGFKPAEEFNHLFAEKLKEFAAFNGCRKIVIEKAEKNWKKQMVACLNS
ncbi:MAG TPA: crosslink repair DNA glycosylase YcaQ family protein [Bacteroidia bacterium]|jgi:hypothetical protein